MKLKEVIRIDEKFQHSINLKLDQMRKEPIENYIPKNQKYLSEQSLNEGTWAGHIYALMFPREWVGPI